MKQLIISISLLLFIAGVRADAQSLPEVAMIEFQTASSESASDEFIEIINLSHEVVELNTIELQYKSAGGNSWLTKHTLSGLLKPHARVMIASGADSASSTFTFSGGLAGSGGHLRLFDTDSQTQLDLVGYGTAAAPLGEAALAPAAGQSAKRLVDEDGYFSLSDDNNADWFISETSTPHSDGLSVVETNPETTSGNNETDTSTSNEPTPTDAETVHTPKRYVSLILSELMPDPVAPLSDAEDEFVEIYNPNTEVVNLDGYYLAVDGRALQLSGYTVSAGGFVAIYSSDSNLSLSNSGRKVELFAGDGRLLDTTTYEDANPGESWSLVAGIWQWSNPTPETANVAFSEQAETPQDSNDISNKDRNYVLSSLSSSDDIQSDDRTTYQAPTEATIEPLDYSVLAAVGALSVCYVLYEYRHDLGNRFQQLRRYVANRRENRAETKGRGSHRTVQRYRRWKNNVRAWLGLWHQKS